MKNNRNKTLATIALILTLTSIMLLATPAKPVEAQLATQQPTRTPPPGVTPNATLTPLACLNIRPNPVGLNQIFLVNMWTAPAPGANRKHWNYTLTITKPNGSKVVIVMDSYVADGTAWFEYIADQEGEWKFKFDFLGTYYPAGRYYNGYIVTNTSGTLYTESVYYQPSSSPEVTLTVKKDYVALSWPESPLPTDYWTRPVSPENREWWVIMGNYPWHGQAPGPFGEKALAVWDELYPGCSKYWNPRQFFTPYVQGPESPHIVWKRQVDLGGIVGGAFGLEYFTWPVSGGPMPSIIFQGRGYITLTKAFNGKVQNVWQCYDLRTGEVYWELIGVTPPTVIEYSVQAATVPGEQPRRETPNLVYIGGGYLVKYNPFTGAVARNESISPLTTGTYYRNGYVLSVQDLGAAAAPNRYRLINWTTLGTATTFKSRIKTNISWPLSTLPGTVDFSVNIAVNIASITVGGAYLKQNVTAYDLKTGAKLWSKIINEPPYSGGCNVADHGKVAVLSAYGYYVGFDLLSGDQVWKSDTMDYPWDECGWGVYSVRSAYGMFFREAMSGVYAFNWTNGKIVWKFEAPALFPYEAEYTGRNGTTVYPFNSHSIIADGKLYVYNGEHSPDTPLNRGYGTYCVNVTTGELIWKIMIQGRAWGGTAGDLIVADGYLSLTSTDGYLYVIGKGKSQTTVAVSQDVVSKGSTVLVKGSVLDMSPAQPGTPCVSKESMSTWMEYLHKQMPINGVYGNATIIGVPVTLTAIGDDGSYIDIGTVVTDGYSGTFAVSWTPPEEGTYRIVASFAGDDSYGSSSAATWITVGPPPAEIEIPEYPTPTDYTPILTGVIIAIIAIALLVVYTLYTVRKLARK
ncbi:MAG: PQQ-binding-like beta-propeller repeat protein [Candidatus Bathyarchaeales archaeon]